MSKVILHLCADTGTDSWYYQQDPGFTVIRVGAREGVANYEPPADVYGVIANPVCTEFSFAKWANNQGKGDHDQGMEMVNHCLRIIKRCSPTFWAIENPATGRLREFLGKPTQVYQPWEYGDPWTKKTALWGDFIAPKPLYDTWEDVPKISELYVRPGRSKPSLAFLHRSAIRHIPAFQKFDAPTDRDFRSFCSQGFAEAFYNANRGD